MSDKPMTRQQVEDLIENVGLKFSQVVSEKLEEYGDKQKKEHQLARESTFEQATGFAWDERADVKAAINYAHAAQKNALLWKSAGVFAFTGLVIKAWWADIFPG